jgi:hypothetical protein
MWDDEWPRGRPRQDDEWPPGRPRQDDEWLPGILRWLLNKPPEKPKRANASVSVIICGPRDAWEHKDYHNYYEAVASYLDRHHRRYDFCKHESGPEIIVYLAVGTAGITLAKSVIDFVTALIKARSGGIKRGDEPANPIEIVVRRYGGGNYEQEYALRIPANATVQSEAIKEAIAQAITRAGDKLDFRLARSPWQKEIAQFANPIRVYSCEDVLARPSPILLRDGVYGWVVPEAAAAHRGRWLPPAPRPAASVRGDQP